MEDVLRDMFVGLKENYELEVRFEGHYFQKRHVHKFLAKHLDKFTENTYKERISKSVKNSKSVYRHRIIDNNSIFDYKTLIVQEKIPDNWLKIVVSSETEINPNIIDNIFSKEQKFENIVRYTGIIGNCKVEIGRNVEVEKMPNTKVEDMIKTIEWILVEIQESTEIITRTTHDMFCQYVKNCKKPVTLSINKIDKIKEVLLVTPKLDGERIFLIFCKNKQLICNQLLDLKMINSDAPILTSGATIVDCEFVNNNYYMIEVIIYNNLYITNVEQRITIDVGIPIKPYYKFTKLDDILITYNNSELPCDGTILVTPTELLKWKPQVTVDIIPKSNRYNGWLVEGPKSNNVCEFIVDHKNNKLVFLKERPDKEYPNNHKVFDENVLPQIDFLYGRGILLMKHYHNTTKSNMVSHLKGSVLLDIGCRTGNKYYKHIPKNFSNCYCIDPGNNQLKFKQKNVSDRFIYIRTKLSEFQTNDIFDVILSFNSMNLFEQNDYNMLYNILKDHSKKGTKFIGICLITSYPYSCEAFSCTTVDNTYCINITDTKIYNSVEHIVDIKNLQKNIENIGYKTDYIENLDKEEFLTNNEKILSSWYCKFSFTKHT